MPDRPFAGLKDNDIIELQVWICPKKVNLIKQISTIEWGAYAQAKVNEIAEKDCLKANIGDNNRSYSINDISPGQYEIAAIARIVTPPALAVPRWRWWVVPVSVYKNKSVDLMYWESNLNK